MIQPWKIKERQHIPGWIKIKSCRNEILKWCVPDNHIRSPLKQNVVKKVKISQLFSNQIYSNIKLVTPKDIIVDCLSQELCPSSTNLPHLNNSSADQLLDLVHHHWILRMFLRSLRIFLEINQHLHRQYTPKSDKHVYRTTHLIFKIKKNQTCLITGSWRMLWISGSCIAFACKNTKYKN